VPVDTVANGERVEHSQVTYGPGGEQAARFVAGQLGNLPTELSPDLHPRTVRVQLAKDYAGPGAQDDLAGAQPVHLDGGLGRRAAPAPPSDDAISAAGIPCVN
jgi:hypothetical protein